MQGFRSKNSASGTFLERIKTETRKKKTKDKFGINKNDLGQQIIKQNKNLKLQKDKERSLQQTECKSRTYVI
ncbi:unnamed protein product [Brassica oleracea]